MATDKILFNPYPGLRPFKASESHLFFGCDDQISDLLKRLRRNRFVAVVGTSGSGKSSLVHAGLLPALFGGFMARTGGEWRVATFRPGGDPIGSITQALESTRIGDTMQEEPGIRLAQIEATLRRTALGLVELIAQSDLQAGTNLLLVVDQFEELFRFKLSSERADASDEAAAFVKLLLEATRQDELPIYVVITMRSDFLGDCAQFRDLPEAINDGQYLIPRMTREQRRAAITGPAAVARSRSAISPRLINRLLNDVSDDPDQLPILQHALMRSWDHWAQHGGGREEVDLSDYDFIGTTRDALSRHADEAYLELPDERSRTLAETLFKCLTEKGPDNREIRRPTRMRQICAIASATPEEVGSVIESFRRPGRSFLMPPAGTSLTDDTLIDISHESLIRGWVRLKGWVEEEAQATRIYRRLAETAVLHKEGKAGLWRDPDLQVALTWYEKQSPNREWAQRYNQHFDEAKAFLKESQDAKEADARERERQRRREIRRIRQFSLILVIAFALSTGFGLYAYKKRGEAKAQALLAERKADEAKRALDDAKEQKRLADEARDKVTKQQQLAQKRLIALRTILEKYNINYDKIERDENDQHTER
jgi:hypothetical protein